MNNFIKRQIDRGAKRILLVGENRILDCKDGLIEHGYVPEREVTRSDVTREHYQFWEKANVEATDKTSSEGTEQMNKVNP